MFDRMRLAIQRLRSSFPDAQHDQDLDAEMAAHVDLAVEENLMRGLSPEQARREALVRFGGIEQAKQRQRSARGLPMLDILAQDIRFTFRSLRRDRSFAFISVLILALGIGANISVFSVVNALLLRPLPFSNPQQLAWFDGNKGVGGLSDTTYRVDAYEDFQRHNQSFQNVTAYVPYFEFSDFKLTGMGEPKPVSGLWVAGDFFQTLGVEPVLGRLFLPEESVKGGRSAILLSYPFWQRQFNADRGIVGRSITLNNDQAVTIAGVLPDTFDFGAIFAPGTKMDFFRPSIMDDIRTYGHMLSLIGRLKPGVSVAQAQAEVNILFPQLRPNDDPNWSTDVNTSITPLKDHISGKLRRALIVLWCAVGVILLIVCVNISNLLLSRAAARSKEFAMRTALGAGRGRLVRQLLTESLILASAGTALGLGIAFTIVRYLAHQGSLALPLLSSVRVDGSALLWTVLIAVSAAALFGIAPAFRMAGVNLQESLKDGGPGMSDGRKHERLRSMLVVSEVALACVLMVGAGLLLRSFVHALDVDLGFEPTHAAAINVDYDDGGNAARRGAIMQEILQRVMALPGVKVAGLSDKLPLDRNRSWDLRAKGKVYPKDYNDDAFVYVVSPGYVNAMGMHLRAGRDFTWHDTSSSEHVIIIDEAAARREWPGEDPVGRLAQGIGDGDTRVVGVISDVHESSVEGDSSPQVLVPLTQGVPEGEELVVRSTLPPEVLASSVMSTLRSLNPGQPANEFRPIQHLVDRAVSPRRFFVLLITIFAGLGLLLAALGIYGVISYSVTRQTQEIGIRMALGASAARVQFGVIAKSLQLAAVGVVLGAIVSAVVARSISSLLFGTEPTDPAAFAGMLVVLSAVALFAGYVPARRASRIDPMIALRNN
jgi:predicted permease